MKPSRGKRDRRARREAGASAPADRWRRRYLVGVAIVVSAFACYAAGLGGPFIQDDYFSRPGDLERPGGPRWGTFTAPPQSPMAGRPIPAFSMVLCHEWFGDSPVGYRAFNVALHAVNGLLLWGLVRRTLQLPRLGATVNAQAEPLAAVVALVWLVHPLNTEAAAYITQRTELFVACFLLATTYCSLRAWSSPHATAWKAAAIVCSALGMMSKEVMVAGPLLVPLFDRSFVAASWREAWQRRGGFYCCLAATWLILAVLLATTPRSESVGFGHGVSIVEYLEWQALAIARYLRLSLVPVGLCLDHGDLKHPQLSGAHLARALACGAGIVGLLAAVVWAYVRRPAWGFPGAWFFLILAPTSSFVPIVTEWCAERRMYLPLMAITAGVVVAASMLVRRLAPTEGIARGTGIAGAGAVLVALTAATIARAALYADAIALWSDTVAKNPDNSRPHANLAQMYVRRAEALRESDPAAAEEAAKQAQAGYERGLALDETDRRMHFNLGYVHSLLGRTAEAEARYRRAVELDPNYVKARASLGNLLFVRGDYAEAAEQYAQLVRLEPQSAEWRYNLGLAMAKLNRLAEARQAYGEAAQLQPALFEAWLYYGRISAAAGDLAAAEVAARQMLMLRPNDADARQLAQQIQQARAAGGR